MVVAVSTCISIICSIFHYLSSFHGSDSGIYVLIASVQKLDCNLRLEMNTEEVLEELLGVEVEINEVQGAQVVIIFSLFFIMHAYVFQFFDGCFRVSIRAKFLHKELKFFYPFVCLHNGLCLSYFGL